MSKSQRTVLAMLIVAALIAVAVAAVAAAPAPAPASQPQQAATPAPTMGDWEKIKAAGKIIVGTSADYPPFEYYDKNFKMDGFDIALMQEIGKQLGLKVQFRDMAFDGLGQCAAARPDRRRHGRDFGDPRPRGGPRFLRCLLCGRGRGPGEEGLAHHQDHFCRRCRASAHRRAEGLGLRNLAAGQSGQ